MKKTIASANSGSFVLRPLKIETLRDLLVEKLAGVFEVDTITHESFYNSKTRQLTIKAEDGNLL